MTGLVALAAAGLGLGAWTPGPVGEAERVVVLAGQEGSSVRSGLIERLIAATQRSQGRCPSTQVELLCDARACAISYLSLTEAEAIEQLQHNPAVLAENVLAVLGLDHSLGTPCSVGRSVLAAKEARVSVLSSQDRWTCLLVADTTAGPPAQVTEASGLDWCQQRPRLDPLAAWSPRK
jgi:hypothetical protein